MAAVLGLDHRMYIQTNGAQPEPWPAMGSPGGLVELGIVSDVTIDGSTDADDVSTRSGRGFRQHVGTLSELTLEFDIVYDPANTEYEFLRQAWRNKTVFGVAVLDGEKDTAGTQGFWLHGNVTGFEKEEALDAAGRVSVTIQNSRVEPITGVGAQSGLLQLPVVAGYFEIAPEVGLSWQYLGESSMNLHITVSSGIDWTFDPGTGDPVTNGTGTGSAQSIGHDYGAEPAGIYYPSLEVDLGELVKIDNSTHEERIFYAPFSLDGMDGLTEIVGAGAALGIGGHAFPDLSPATSLEVFSLSEDSDFTRGTLDFSSNTSLTEVRFGWAPTNSADAEFPTFPTSIEIIDIGGNWTSGAGFVNDFGTLTGYTALTEFQVYNHPLMAGAIPAFPTSIEVVRISRTGRTGSVPSLASYTSLTDFNAAENSLNGWAGSSVPASLTTVDLHDNAFSQSAVDSILAHLDTAGATDGYINLTGNAPPTSAGLTSKSNLETDGWFVNVDNSSTVGLSWSDPYDYEFKVDIEITNTVDWVFDPGTGEDVIYTTGNGTLQRIDHPGGSTPSQPVTKSINAPLANIIEIDNRTLYEPDFDVDDNPPVFPDGFPTLTGLTGLQRIRGWRMTYANNLEPELVTTFPDLSGLSALVEFYTVSEGDEYTGPLSDLTLNTNLQIFRPGECINTGQSFPSFPSSIVEIELDGDFTGSLPSFASYSNLTEVHLGYLSGLTSPGFPVLPTSIEFLNLRGGTRNGNFVFSHLDGTTIPALSSYTAMTDIVARGGYTGLNPRVKVGLTGSVPAINALTSLTRLDLSTNRLTGWAGASVPASLVDVDLYNNELTQTAVDAVLAQLDTAGATNGDLDLRENAFPSAAGLTDVAALEGKGWTVDYNPQGWEWTWENGNQTYFWLAVSSGVPWSYKVDGVERDSGVGTGNRQPVGYAFEHGSQPWDVKIEVPLANILEISNGLGDDTLWDDAPSFAGLSGLKVIEGVGSALIDNEGAFPDLSDCVALENFDLEESANFTSGTVSFTANVALKTVEFSWKTSAGSAPFPTLPSTIEEVRINGSFDQSDGFTGAFSSLSSLSNLTTFHVHWNRMSGAMPAMPTSIENIRMDKTGLTGSVINLATLTSLTDLDLSNNALTGWTGSAVAAALNDVDLSNNSLTQGAVDAVLDQLDTAGGTNGTVDLTGNTAPSAAGLTDKSSLEGKGWTVNVDS